MVAWPRESLHKPGGPQAGVSCADTFRSPPAPLLIGNPKHAGMGSDFPSVNRSDKSVWGLLSSDAVTSNQRLDQS